MTVSENMGGGEVYEIDTNALLSEVRERLGTAGYEVIEQVPAGIWWVRAGRHSSEAGIQVVFDETLHRHLRRVQQE